MASKNSNGMGDEFIDVEAVEVQRRGRKPVLDQGLLDTLASIPEGKAIRLAGTFGPVAKDDRPAVSGVIRKHWRAVYGETSKPRIDFAADGVAQVRAKR